MKREKYKLGIIEVHILIIVTLLAFTGCSKEEKPEELKLGNYVMESTETKLGAYVLIEEDNKFQFLRNYAVSYIPMGTYSIDGNELTLYVNEDESYLFTINEDQLIFESSNVDISQFVKKGAIFKFSEEDQTLSYDAYEDLVF